VHAGGHNGRPAEEAAVQPGPDRAVPIFGASLPLPGISETNVQYCSGLADTSGSPVAGVYAMLNVLSGNALQHVTVFALGIMPYITASIAVQLLTQVIPRLERLKQEGQAGTAKITQCTRYLTRS
jgi:preprotein translocase subunit SecY